MRVKRFCFHSASLNAYENPVGTSRIRTDPDRILPRPPKIPGRLCDNGTLYLRVTIKTKTMKREENNRLAEQSIDRAIESVTDGIVILYKDHLSMDAFRVYVRKGGKAVKPEKKYRYKWNDEKKNYEILEEESAKWDCGSDDYREVNMVGSSNYYGSVGLIDTVKLLYEKHGLPVYYLNIGWCTFPQAWRDMSSFIDCIKRCVSFEVNLLECDYTPCKLKELED